MIKLHIRFLYFELLTLFRVYFIRKRQKVIQFLPFPQHEMQLLQKENEALQSQCFGGGSLDAKSSRKLTFRSSVAPSRSSDVLLITESSLLSQGNPGLSSLGNADFLFCLSKTIIRNCVIGIFVQTCIALACYCCCDWWWISQLVQRFLFLFL